MLLTTKIVKPKMPVLSGLPILVLKIVMSMTF